MPGRSTTAWHAQASAPPEIRTWYGSLTEGMRDGSGKLYMRNRYYDPSTGQFTQTDPIGLAGGLNAYGFAAGDPVSYADPYGLCRQRTGFLAFIGNWLDGRCKTGDDAARHAMRSIYRRSVRENLEWGGEVVRDGSGYRHTTPRRGTPGSVLINTNAQGYEGAYHSHGAEDPAFASENFSNGDRDLADYTDKPVYVVTPRGRMKRYDPDPQDNRGGQETEIGRLEP